MAEVKSREIVLKVDHLNVSYDKVPVLWDLSLEVPAGSLVGIIGPNGAGKTTFLKAALGMVRPLTGSIELFSKPYKEVRHRIAYVPQRSSVDWEFPIRVIDVVLMGRYGRLGLFRLPRKADREGAMRMLERVGMAEFAQRQIAKLSGGQQQRVFLARALLQEGDLYFFDEPFAGIDAVTEAVIVDSMRQLQQAGKTIFVVHHDLSTVSSYFDWVIILNMRLVGAGPVAEVFQAGALERAFGKSQVLLSEAQALSKTKSLGLP